MRGGGGGGSDENSCFSLLQRDALKPLKHSRLPNYSRAAAEIIKKAFSGEEARSSPLNDRKWGEKGAFASLVSHVLIKFHSDVTADLLVQVIFFFFLEHIWGIFFSPSVRLWNVESD